jgi:hypothetical protein
MKHTFILICVILCSLQTMATNLVLEQRSGAELLQDIAIIGKWVFVEDSIRLLDKEGIVLATEPIPIANVKKIYFAPPKGTETDVNDTLVNTIIVYPNPTQDVLMIQGIESQMLRVYNLQGSLLQTEWGNQIAVSHLPVGTYLLQIGTQVVRFIKK